MRCTVGASILWLQVDEQVAWCRKSGMGHARIFCRLGVMFLNSCASSVGFVPTSWVMMHPGTNGYLSSWGAILAGSSPAVIDI